ncbi:MAG: flagellar basal body-associated FliL family protein [Mariprofundus sp.]
MKLLPLLTAILLVIALSIEGFVAWKLDAMNDSVEPVEGEVAAPVKEVPKAPPVYMDLGVTTVNIGMDQYLRVKITLLLSDAAAQERITQDRTRVTDLILNVLSSKVFSGIRTPEGKQRLKKELVERLNRLVGHDPVKELFFTDFVLQ